MFLVQTDRMQKWLSLLDDVLGDPPPETHHPHRRPLTWQPRRRPGMVTPRPAVCLAPIDGSARAVEDRPEVASCPTTV